MLQDKDTFTIVPAVLLVIALGFETIKMEKLKFYIISVLFVSFIDTAAFGAPIYNVPYPSQQWREVTQKIQQSDKDNQLVFSEYAWYFRYYFKVYKSTNLPFEPGYADFNALVSTSGSVWVLKSTSFSDPGLTPEQQKYLEADFQLIEEFTSADAIAKHYVRR
jgi:hypothetical protein